MFDAAPGLTTVDIQSSNAILFGMMKHILGILLIVASGVGCSRNPRPCNVEQPPAVHPTADSNVTPVTPAESKQPQEAPHQTTRADISADLAKFAPGWMAKDCGAEMSPGVRDALGKTNVLVTHPLSEDTPCVIGRRLDIIPNKKTTLHLTVGHHPEGDWILVVTADRELVRQVIDKETAPDGWTNIDVDLSSYAGQIITVQLINAANPGAPGVHKEAYWAKIELE
jgi:hypothetical protein